MSRLWLGLVLLALGVAAAQPATSDEVGHRGGAENGRLAISVNRTGINEIVLMTGWGKNRQRITPAPPRGSDAAGYLSPAWSPDGKRIAFSGTGGAVDEALSDSEIYSARPSGRGLRRLTRNRVGEYEPSWSPDGTRIAFVRSTKNGARSAIFVMSSDGSNIERVTRGSAFDLGPDWAPQGNRILFTRARFGQGGLRSRIFVLRLGSNGSLRSLAEGYSPEWSPSGRRISFISTRDRFGRTCFHECSPSGEIYVMRASGSHERRVTHSRADDAAPAFAPGGRVIGFSSDRSDPDGHAYEIYLMHANGSCVERITRTRVALWDREPAWDPRGGVPRLPC